MNSILNDRNMEELNGKQVQLSIAGAHFFGIFNHNYTSFRIDNIGDFCPACFEVEILQGCFILHQVKL